MKENILDRLQNVFRHEFDDEELVLSREMSAKDIDDWDSLMHVHLMVNVEKEFGLRFKSSQIADLKNVGELADLLDALLRQGNGTRTS